MKKFNLYFAVISVVVDLIAIELGLILAYYLRSDNGYIFMWPLNRYLAFTFYFLPLWLILLANQGVYNVNTPVKGWSAFARLTTGLLSGWAAMLIVLYLSRSPEALVFPRLVIAYGLGITWLFLLSGRFLLDTIRKQLMQMGLGLIQTAVVSASEESDLVQRLKNPIHGRQLVGVVQGDLIKELNQIWTNQRFDEIILANPALAEREVFEVLDWAENKGINCVQVPSLMFLRASNIENGTLGGTPVLFYRRTPLDGWGRIYKRFFDLIISLVALLVLSPLFLLIAFLVKLSSPGPVFYTQARIGQNGNQFKIHKFRSMYGDANERFQQFKGWSGDEKTDPRITPLGRIMRKTDLDELPQLWDVFIGNLSLVGPRPEQPQYVEQFTQAVPNYFKRHNVKAGLTGWAQVNGLRGNTSIPERVKYDLYYIENWSIWFDLRIILATIIHVMRRISN